MGDDPLRDGGMRQPPVHWYHVWAGDDQHASRWESAASEHFEALHVAAFTGDVMIGLVGQLPYRERAVRMISQWYPSARIMVQADEGYEQVTIAEMHKWCKWARPDVAVYYAHTKGALQPCEMNVRWRNAMDSLLVDFWQDRVEDLKTHDAVGLHWLTHEAYPDWINPAAPMFGGNFWWANAGYLAGLPPVEGGLDRPPVNRWGAEGWVGRNFPKVRDLVPGWPDYSYDHPVAIALTRT
jgi:hypothetical protein